jgi:hypothetical protein
VVSVEIVFLTLISGLLFLQSWDLRRFYLNSKSLGVLAAAVAIALLATVVFQDKEGLRVLGDGPNVSVATTVLVLAWAGYAGVLAGVALWGFDERSLGVYSLFLSVASLLFAVYFITPGAVLTFLPEDARENITTIMALSSLVVAALAALLFFRLGVPFTNRIYNSVVAWFFLVGSVAIGVLALISVLALFPI